jgi:hypothetical protein
MHFSMSPVADVHIGEQDIVSLQSVDPAGRGIPAAKPHARWRGCLRP